MPSALRNAINMSDLTWTFSQSFSAQFQASRAELESRVDLAKSTKVTADVLQTLSLDLATLTKTLSDATGSLPSYDQRQYELQLKGLQKSLEDLRTLIPKSKFAFKRKVPVPSSEAPSSPDPPVIAETTSESQPGSAPTVSTNLTLSSHSNQYLTMASLPCTAQTSDLAISDLDKCIVNLLPDAEDADSGLKISALHIRNLTDTVLLLPAIQGSVLLHDLRRCVVVVGCHQVWFLDNRIIPKLKTRQFRMHTSTHVDVYLSIHSTPIIEHCSQIRFASYPTALRTSEDTSPHVLSVQDFSHIKSTPSPNWSMLAPENQVSKWPIRRTPQEVEDLLDALLPRS
ncbi:Tubulin-folding cofactor C [Mycena sanguinolenta]|uniref:Tubulin-folding cofactor C n=1 Tax=Mycena sanguinolenta TaxID=230812 RepID=A0A8H7DC54_9AGAR|nr:Tubulin-folding cofactor C [Mycena sanguinolenta]